MAVGLHILLTIYMYGCFPVIPWEFLKLDYLAKATLLSKADISRDGKVNLGTGLWLVNMYLLQRHLYTVIYNRFQRTIEWSDL